MVDRDDLAIGLDEPARFDDGGHPSTARSAASAAFGGSEPTSVVLRPPFSTEISVPSAVGSSCPVAPSIVTVGRPSSGLLPTGLGRRALEHGDGAEALAVGHEHGGLLAVAEQADAGARQADERVGRGERERDGGLDGLEPFGRRAAVLVLARRRAAAR